MSLEKLVEIKEKLEKIMRNMTVSHDTETRVSSQYREILKLIIIYNNK